MPFILFIGQFWCTWIAVFPSARFDAVCRKRKFGQYIENICIVVQCTAILVNVAFLPDIFRVVSEFDSNIHKKVAFRFANRYKLKFIPIRGSVCLSVAG